MSRRLGFAALAAAALCAAACDRASDNFAGGTPSIDDQLRATIRNWGAVPIGQEPAQDTNLVKLGRLLMFDPILSGNKDRACASCHNPTTHMADARSLAVGTRGRLVPRAAPSLMGIGLGLYQLFWDGRLENSSDLVARQAMLPVVNRLEMRGDSATDGPANELAVIRDADSAAIYAAIMARLMAIPQYVTLFDAAFGAGSHTYQQAARAIAAFEIAALARTDSPFDRYLRREDAALTLEQKQGALLFFGNKAMCAQCHSGALLGGNGGIANTGAPQIGQGLDSGRAAVPSPFGGNNSFYRFAFRIPPLRNVELTAPYFHDGAYPTLALVVKHYNDVRTAQQTYDPANVAAELRPLIHTDAATLDLVDSTLAWQLRQPLGLTDAEQAAIVAFLKSLTDPAARDLSALRPAAVPSGLPVP